MKKKTRTLVFMAVLIAIMLIFGFTPIGYIPLPFAELTLMCLPVIIGTFVLGLRAGFGLSIVFILTSLAQLLMKPSALALILLDSNALLCVLGLIIPRLLIAPACWWTAKALSGHPRVGLVVGSAAGSLVNTFVYLALLQAWFAGPIAAGYAVPEAAAAGLIWGVVLTNGLPEAALAAIVCPVVTRALSKSVPQLEPVRRG